MQKELFEKVLWQRRYFIFWKINLGDFGNFEKGLELYLKSVNNFLFLKIAWKFQLVWIQECYLHIIKIYLGFPDENLCLIFMFFDVALNTSHSVLLLNFIY